LIYLINTKNVLLPIGEGFKDRNSTPDFNKVLVDLEIYGLIRVSWVAKDKRRIEAAEGKGFKIEVTDSVD
jgi:hypothetical protein